MGLGLGLSMGVLNLAIVVPLPRIQMAMARDGLLPPFFSDVNKKITSSYQEHSDYRNRCCNVVILYGGFWGNLVPENALNTTSLEHLLKAGALDLKAVKKKPFMMPKLG